VSLLQLSNVSKEYKVRAKRGLFSKKSSSFKAVKEVNLRVGKGESLGLVGESGSGKSTLSKLIMKLESVTTGEIYLEGQPICGRQIKDLVLYKRIQLVLQDSSASLHPQMKVVESLYEPIRNFFPHEKAKWDDMLNRVIDLVGIDSSHLMRYPHQLSGGQKQRICIAKALAVQPDLIIFDESIASLEKASQEFIVRMLKDIQDKEQLSFLFITHDLYSAKQLCNRIAVMLEGEIVEVFEQWNVNELKHPYTRSLLKMAE
jgi:ABC-type oligopeptide transport system ATPase subunit